MLAIGDCGLPIPPQTFRIDLALKKGVPSFLETLKVVLVELQVEEIVLAEEIRAINPALLQKIQEQMGNVKLTFVSHEELKSMLTHCRAVVRTGEQTPYANIILKSGVIF